MCVSAVCLGRVQKWLLFIYLLCINKLTFLEMMQARTIKVCFEIFTHTLRSWEECSDQTPRSSHMPSSGRKGLWRCWCRCRLSLFHKSTPVRCEKNIVDCLSDFSGRVPWIARLSGENIKHSMEPTGISQAPLQCLTSWWRLSSLVTVWLLQMWTSKLGDVGTQVFVGFFGERARGRTSQTGWSDLHFIIFVSFWDLHYL